MKRFKTIAITITLLTALILSSVITASAEAAVRQYGEAKMVTSTFPVIDGHIDDIWEDANAYYLDIIKVGEDTGVKAYFKLLWSPTTLYGLVVVPDTTPNHDEYDNYQRDCIEVGFDLSNSRETSYINDDQFHITMRTNGDGVEIKDVPSPFSDAELTWGLVESETGYIYEFAIACDKLGVTLSDDKMIGFDAQVNDNAEGFGRTGCYAWNDDADASYNNPSYFGEIKLVAVSVEPVAETVEEVAPAAENEAAPEVVAAPAPAPISAPVAPQTSDLTILLFAAVLLSAFIAAKHMKKIKR